MYSPSSWNRKSAVPGFDRSETAGEFVRHWRRRASPADPRVRQADENFAALRTEKLARLEAALFVSEGPLPAAKLAQHATLEDAAEANRLVARLNASYDESGCAFRVERLATGFRLLTRPAYAFWVSKIHQQSSDWKLSAPQMETLTIVAYRQPITRADIEAIRGVQCAYMLKQLMDRGLVKIGGEEDSLGRPFLYITTRKFLDLFGIGTLNDLPMADRLRQAASRTQIPSAEIEDAA